MHTRHLFRPLAAATLALGLVSPAAAAPPSETLTTLLAEQAGSAATAEQLAEQYPALALLPASATDFFTLNISVKHFFMLEPIGEKNNTMTALESIALATTADNMTRLCAALTHSLGIGQDERPADAAPLQPIHIVITCKPGEEVLLIMLASKLQSRPGISPLTELPEGCFGGLIGEGYEKQVPDTLAPLIRALRESAPERPLHLMSSMKGNALILVLCENPADATHAATPADSVLATAAGRALTPDAEGQQSLAALHLSPNSLGELRREALKQAYDFFTREGQAPAFAEGAPVLERFCRAMAAHPATKPTTLQIRKEPTGAQEAYSLTLTADALGMRFEPAELRQLTVADQNPTIFYGETTPLTLPGDVTTPALLRALAEWSFSQILVLKVEEPEKTTSPDSPIFIEHNYTESPLFDKVPAGLEQMLGSMQSPTTLVLDAGRGDDDGPRIELCTGLTDRRQLEQGFAALAADYAATNHPLPEFTVSADGNSYTLSEVDAPQMCANAAMTATQLAFGLSPTLGQELLANAARPGHPAAGAVFAFRPEPLADRDRSLRDMSGSIESILGTATITEGVFTLRLRLTLPPQDKN